MVQISCGGEMTGLEDKLDMIDNESYFWFEQLGRSNEVGKTGERTVSGEGKSRRPSWTC